MEKMKKGEEKKGFQFSVLSFQSKQATISELKTENWKLKTPVPPRKKRKKQKTPLGHDGRFRCAKSQLALSTGDAGEPRVCLHCRRVLAGEEKP